MRDKSWGNPAENNKKNNSETIGETVFFEMIRDLI